MNKYACCCVCNYVSTRGASCDEESFVKVSGEEPEAREDECIDPACSS